MPIKPWYNVVNPREDLRKGKLLDASHLISYQKVWREELEEKKRNRFD